MVRMLIPIVIVFFLYKLIKWIGDTNRETNEAFLKVSEKLGFHYKEETKWWKKKNMSGVIDGYKCEITVYTQSHGQSSTTYISFFTYFPNSLDMGLKINWRGKFEGDASNKTIFVYAKGSPLLESFMKPEKTLPYMKFIRTIA